MMSSQFRNTYIMNSSPSLNSLTCFLETVLTYKREACWKVQIWSKKKVTEPILHLLVEKIVCLVKDLLEYCPSDTLRAGRNCKRTNVSVILSAPKLNQSWVNDPQRFLFFPSWLYVVEQLWKKKGGGIKKVNNQENS